MFMQVSAADLWGHCFLWIILESTEVELDLMRNLLVVVVEAGWGCEGPSAGRYNGSIWPKLWLKPRRRTPRQLFSFRSDDNTHVVLTMTHRLRCVEVSAM